MVAIVVGAISLTAVKANALSFSDITDAITGHVSDISDRILVEDEHIDGHVVATAEFTESADSIHWVNGSFSVIFKHGKTYVQLNDDFEAGLAPDLYLYVNDMVEIAKLTKGVGASYYEIPDHIVVERVIIWCKRFSQFMGAGNVNH